MEWGSETPCDLETQRSAASAIVETAEAGARGKGEGLEVRVCGLRDDAEARNEVGYDFGAGGRDGGAGAGAAGAAMGGLQLLGVMVVVVLVVMVVVVVMLMEAVVAVWLSLGSWSGIKTSSSSCVESR